MTLRPHPLTICEGRGIAHPGIAHIAHSSRILAPFQKVQHAEDVEPCIMLPGNSAAMRDTQSAANCRELLERRM